MKVIVNNNISEKYFNVHKSKSDSIRSMIQNKQNG